MKNSTVDKSGAELKVGDQVVIPARIRDITSQNAAADLLLETEWPGVGTEKTLIALASKQVLSQAAETTPAAQPQQRPDAKPEETNTETTTT